VVIRLRPSPQPGPAFANLVSDVYAISLFEIINIILALCSKCCKFLLESIEDSLNWVSRNLDLSPIPVAGERAALSSSTRRPFSSPSFHSRYACCQTSVLSSAVLARVGTTLAQKHGGI